MSQVEGRQNPLWTGNDHVTPSIKPEPLNGNSKRASSTTNKLGPSKATLYVKLGGPAAVAAVVDLFYQKLLSDPELARFFEGVDMVTLVAKQNRFLSYAFGATVTYTGKDIVMGHAHLIVNKGLDQSHFDRVVGHFVDSLKEMGVGQDIIDEAGGVLLAVRPLFNPQRYKGKIDVDKIEKSATPVAGKAGQQEQGVPACCTVM